VPHMHSTKYASTRRHLRNMRTLPGGSNRNMQHLWPARSNLPKFISGGEKNREPTTGKHGTRRENGTYKQAANHANYHHQDHDHNHHQHFNGKNRSTKEAQEDKRGSDQHGPQTNKSFDNPGSTGKLTTLCFNTTATDNPRNSAWSNADIRPPVILDHEAKAKVPSLRNMRKVRGQNKGSLVHHTNRSGRNGLAHVVLNLPTSIRQTINHNKGIQARKSHKEHEKQT